jgi:hypothetical protein
MRPEREAVTDFHIVPRLRIHSVILLPGSSCPHLLLYRLAKKSVNWSVKCTQKYVKNVSITEFSKVLQNDILHVQCTTHNTVIPAYKLTGRFKISTFPLIRDSVLGGLTFGPLCITKYCVHILFPFRSVPLFIHVNNTLITSGAAFLTFASIFFMHFLLPSSNLYIYIYSILLLKHVVSLGARISQSLRRLATGWTVGD